MYRRCKCFNLYDVVLWCIFCGCKSKIVMFVGLYVKLKGYDFVSLNENEFSKILVIFFFF